jgi:hypothetical protein
MFNCRWAADPPRIVATFRPRLGLTLRQNTADEKVEYSRCFPAVQNVVNGPERSPRRAAFESGVGGIAVTAAGYRRGRV